PCALPICCRLARPHGPLRVRGGSFRLPPAVGAAHRRLRPHEGPDLGSRPDRDGQGAGPRRVGTRHVQAVTAGTDGVPDPEPAASSPTSRRAAVRPLLLSPAAAPPRPL